MSEIINKIYLILPIISIFFMYSKYSNIIRYRNNVLSALSSIDIHLQKRYELLPNLLKIAKKFMDHEKKLLEDITSLRTQALGNYNKFDPKEVKNHIDLLNNLQNKMHTFIVNSENYPELKSDQAIINLQKTFNEVEEQISAARRFYNSAVTELNNSVEIFPGNILASLMKISKMPFYETYKEVANKIDPNQFL